MGQPSPPSTSTVVSRAGRGHLVRCCALAATLLASLVLTPLLSGAPAAAQTLSDSLAPKADKNAKMLVEADQLVQNDKTNTVSALGNVRIYYDGRTLEADHVDYDKTSKRLVAYGHAKLTERDGTVYHGDKFDLTDDFRDGFVDSLRVDTTDKRHFSAPRSERIDGQTTVFEKGTYTACDACKDDPSKPPLWRVRARRIIHQNDEQMIYYENAYLEFLGIPVAYVPILSAPDPTVEKKSGVLAPHTLYRSQLGYGVGVPIFFNLAPDYDFTFTPTVFTNQGFFGAAEYRQRFQNGLFYFRASGIDETNPSAFAGQPYGAGGRALRGDIDTKGDFAINDRWKFGWNIAVLSDKYFLTDYSVPTDTLSSNYFSESISTIYLTGQGDRSFFDLRGFYIQGLSSHDIQAQQPIAHPVLDYNHQFDIDPAKTWGIGGEATVDFNLTSLSASSAAYQEVGPRQLDSAFGLYDVCNNYVPGRTPAALGNSCLLRGIGGDYTRATAQFDWQRKFIDPIGEVWTPFAFARFNGETLNLNLTNSYGFTSANGSSFYTNASQTAFLPGGSGTTGNLIPGVGVEYRYPFLASTRFGSLMFEPIGQLIARPNSQIGTRTLVNLDAQSLVFDTSNLFDWNKFSGYDRFETGLRANYGAQLSFNVKNGGYANIIAGQSVQVAGTNAYATPDAANIGLSSGLNKRVSDYVVGATIAPYSFVSLGTQGRWDNVTLENRRVDATMNLNFGALTGAVQFANYQAQPLIGYDVRREGLALLGKYTFAENFFAEGNVTFDMSRHLYPLALIGGYDPGPFAVAALGVGGGYTDECTTFKVTYTSIYQDNGTGTFERNQTVLVSLQLRTLGGTSLARSTLSNTAYNGLDAVR